MEMVTSMYMCVCNYCRVSSILYTCSGSQLGTHRCSLWSVISCLLVECGGQLKIPELRTNLQFVGIILVASHLYLVCIYAKCFYCGQLCVGRFNVRHFRSFFSKPVIV